MIFMKPCKIIGYCYGKNCFNFGVGPSQSGRLVAILDFCLNVLCIDHVD